MAVMTIVRSFRKPFGANPSVFLTSGESSFGALYIEGHRVGPAGVLADHLVLPVFLQRHLTRTLRSGRASLSAFPAAGAVPEPLHLDTLPAVSGWPQRFPCRAR